MVESIANILKYLQKKNIHLDRKEFSFQINSHPAFPSLLSIVSTLNVNYVCNFAVEIDNSEIDELPDDFMTFITVEGNKQELAFVEKTNKDFLINGKYKVSEKEFLSSWNNIVVLIDEHQSVLKKEAGGRYKFLLAGIFMLAVLIYFQISLHSFIFLFLSLCGFLLAVVSLRKVFGIESPVVDKVCSGTYTDCSLSEDNTTGFVSHFGNFSLVYFLSNIVSLLFLCNSGSEDVFFTIQKTLLIIILPVIGYSLFYQLFKIRKVCPLCIGIIIILLLQTSILLM
ncbi:vitamin K epoxide reductase family protein [Chryseobacterium lathyri]|uniref:Membrane protein n=1 Tax=Chryseobacterium lathyri TaxID=395933 RepID=A0ABT9SI57_9FLAO|nr:vitamin K epoxide reductase family protein [Chryseobacterium lathyri]MDP9958140.1 putative membrane protein [Chryseobacterium lathyri]